MQNTYTCTFKHNVCSLHIFFFVGFFFVLFVFSFESCIYGLTACSEYVSLLMIAFWFVRGKHRQIICKDAYSAKACNRATLVIVLCKMSVNKQLKKENKLIDNTNLRFQDNLPSRNCCQRISSLQSDFLVPVLESASGPYTGELTKNNMWRN